jgi:hypothetical protein
MSPFFPRSAAAEPASTGLETVSDPAARQAAEAIACTSLPARHYLRHALRDVDARRWGTVMTTLQGDTVDLVADAVYAAAARPEEGDPIQRFVGAPTATCTPAERAAARHALDRPEEASAPTAVDRCLARPFHERRRDPACSLAAAVRAAMDGDVPAARENVADVVAAVTFDVLYTGHSLSEAQANAMFERVAYALRRVILATENEPTIVEDVAHAFGTLDLDAVRGWRCKDDAPPVMGDPTSIFCAATVADYAPIEVKVDGKTVPTDLRAARATAGERDVGIASFFLCEAGVQCAGGKLEPTKAQTVKLDVGGSTFHVVLAPKSVKVDGRLAATVDHAGEIARLHGEIGTLVRDELLGEEPKPAQMRELATVALRLRRIAQTLDDAVQAGDRNAFILGPLETLPALLPRFEEARAPRAMSCAAPRTNLERMHCAATGSLRATIIAAEDNHLRELASRVASLVGPRDRSSCVAPSSAGLLEAFAANVPETHPHEDAWAGVEQIRGAAREVATCQVASAPDPVFKFSLIPSPAVRASWNSAYFNAFGGDGFRVVPSLDFVSARLRLTPPSSKARVSLGVSVFDPLAPLAELAMRRSDLNYDRQELVWLDAIRPRLDLQFSAPSISRHVFLTGGFGLRTVAPYRGGRGLTPHTATYLAIGTPGGAAAQAFASYVEYNLGVKYAF